MAGQVPMYLPSRMMVTSSEMRRISSILWEIYMIAQPSFRRLSMMPNRISTSFWVKEEVGSSMMTIRALAETALAISTSCIWDTERVPSLALGSKSRPKPSSSALVSLYILS